MAPSKLQLSLNTAFCVLVIVSIHVWSFGLYSQAARYQLGFDAWQTSMLFDMNALGYAVGYVLSGTFMKSLGVSLTFLVGGGLAAAGLTASSLAIMKLYPSTAGLMWFLFFVWGLGQGLYALTAFAVNIRNFEAKSRGKIAGLSFGSAMAGPAIYSLIYDNLFVIDPANYSAESQNVSGFLLFCAILSGCVTLFGAVIVRVWDTDRRGRTRGDAQLINKKVPHEYETMWQVARTPYFMAYTWAYFAMSGVEKTYAADLGRLGQGLGLDSLVANHVIVNGVFNAIARISGGFLLDHFRFSIPAWFWMECAFLSLAVSLVLLIVFARRVFAVYITTILCSLSGSYYAICGATLANVFGARHVADCYGTFVLFGTFGILANGWWNSVIADKHVQPPQTDTQLEGICYGEICFREAHIISLCFVILGMISVAIWGRDRVPRNEYASSIQAINQNFDEIVTVK